MTSPVSIPIGADEEDEQARINALFYEADKLEDIAYRLFDESTRDADVWQHFSEVKAAADLKRTEACRAWMNMRRKALRPAD
ncbi:hypothetical protein SB725_15705 [Pseudomonas sp. SIMBA_041]|jgi:phytoene dehydrogenase-like protein|uniref:hypothetical protein n=1 Tax=Pseudomonas sp. SIMBA_041 TaxID=3085782 RepID=UPI00397A7E4F